MIDTPDPRIKKLPLWAQEEFKRLQRIVEDQGHALADLKDGPAETDTIADPAAGMVRKGDTPMPLRPGTDVKFMIGAGWGEEFNVRVKTLENGKKVLEVSGERRMALRAMSSNVIHFFALPLEDA